MVVLLPVTSLCASAGRLASSNPNMQSIPAHDDRGRVFRAAFAADPGHVLLAADYSQVSDGTLEAACVQQKGSDKPYTQQG